MAVLADLLSDGASLKTGPFGTALAASEYSDTGVPVVSVGEVGDGYLALGERTRRVSPTVTSRLSEYLLADRDIVFARKGSVDRTALVRPHEAGYFLGSDGLRLRLGETAHARFISLQLRSSAIKSWLLQHAGGSTLHSLNQETICRIPLWLPPLPTQRAIAEVLGALDDKIAANEAVAVSVDEYCEALFAGVSRPEARPLSTIARVNVTTRKPDDGHLRYLDISAVSVGRFNWPGRSSWADAPGRARRGVKAGDTVWSTVRPNRRSHALVLDDDPELVGSTGLAVLSPIAGRSALVYQATKTPAFLSYLEAVAEGSAYPAVRAERFMDAPIPSMEAHGEERFEATAYPARFRAHCATTESRHLATLRDTLLPHLMSGRLTVRDAEARVEAAL